MGVDGSHIICPNCTGTNRVPAGKDARQAKCGRCGMKLFSGQPVAADGAQFDKQIARSDVPVVVDFWADWCGPCHAMAPIYEEATAEFEPRLRFLKLDTEAEPGIAGRYNIRGIPTLMVFRHGQVLAQRAGLVDRQNLRAWLAPFAG
jgi:thioredoxin 2